MNQEQKMVIKDAAACGVKIAAAKQAVDLAVDKMSGALVKAKMPKTLATSELVRTLLTVAVIGIVMLIAQKPQFLGVSKKKWEGIQFYMMAAVAALLTEKTLELFKPYLQVVLDAFGDEEPA